MKDYVKLSNDIFGCHPTRVNAVSFARGVEKAMEIIGYLPEPGSPLYKEKKTLEDRALAFLEFFSDWGKYYGEATGLTKKER